MKHYLTIFMSSLTLLIATATFARHDSKPYLVQIRNSDEIETLQKLGATIEKRANDGFVLRLNPAQRDYLLKLGYNITRGYLYPGVQPGWLRSHFAESGYHNYARLTAALKDFATRFPDIVKLGSIGKSVEGREIWALRVTARPEVDEMEPQLRFIGAHHGDEMIAVEVVLEFARYLVENYDRDPRVQSIVNTRDLWLIPMLNPDGVEAVERYNSNGVDLNRNYSYQWSSGWSSGSRPFSEPETDAIRKLSEANQFVLSLTYHAGALVTNYLYNFSETKSEDDDLIIALSLEYAKRNRPMWESDEFDHGVIRGASWYITLGDLNDWSYGVYGGLDWTIELDDAKIPNPKKIPVIVSNNLESMLFFCEVAGDAIRGAVRDHDTQEPLLASVTVEEIGKPIFTNPKIGNFHRIAPPGVYTLAISAPGYKPVRIPGVLKTAGAATDPILVEMDKEN